MMTTIPSVNWKQSQKNLTNPSPIHEKASYLVGTKKMSNQFPMSISNHLPPLNQKFPPNNQNPMETAR